MKPACVPSHRHWQIRKETVIKRSGKFQAALAREPKKNAGWRGSNDLTNLRLAQWRALIDHFPAGVMLVGPTGILLEANTAGVRALNADSRELAAGRSVFPFVAPESRQAFQALTELVCNGEPSFLEFQIGDSVGAPRWLEIYATPLRDEATGNNVMLGITHDITERKCNMEELAATDKRLRLLVEQAADGIFVVSSSDQKFIDANEQGLRMLGCGREELLSMRVQDFVDRADWGRLASHFRQLQPGDEAQQEWSCVPKRGAAFPVEVKSRALDDGNIVGILRDIRERKQVQEELHDAQSFTEQIISAAAQGILVLDREFRYRYWNPGMEEMTEVPRARVLGKSPWELFPFLRETGLQELLARAMQGEVTLSPDFPYDIPSTGRTGWAYQKMCPLRSVSGTITGVIVFVHEVSERKRADEELRQTRRRMDQAVESSNTGLWDWNLLTNEVYFSPIWKRQIGYEDHEIPNRFEEWQNRVHPEDLPKALAKVHSYLKEPWPNYESEFRFRHKDGSYRWILAKASVLRDELKRPIRMQGSHLDVTERKQAEEALHASEERYRAILDQAVDGIFMHDDTGQLLEVNRKACQNLGYSREELLSKSIEKIDPEAVQGHGQFWKGVLAGERHTFESRHVRKDGTTMPVEVSMGSIPQPQGRAIVGFARDITERKRAEEERSRSYAELRALAARLQSAQELERARIARELHDELGQMLTALKMEMASIARRLRRGQEKLRDRVAVTSSLVDSSIANVQEIASGLRAGLLDSLGLEAAIETHMRDFQSRTGVSCSLALPSEPLPVGESAITLFRILQEALTNVARHARAQHVEVNLSHAGGLIMLEVRDDGCGIRVEERTGTHSLGIVGMRERALAVGGKMEITGEPGRGTTVRVTLPIEQRLERSG